MPREILPPRRRVEQIEFMFAPPKSGIQERIYTASIGFYDDGRVGEVFLSSGKTGSELRSTTTEAAILASKLLQNGERMDTVRSSFERTQGEPETALGKLFDIIEDLYGQ